MAMIGRKIPFIGMKAWCMWQQKKGAIRLNRELRFERPRIQTPKKYQFVFFVCASFRSDFEMFGIRKCCVVLVIFLRNNSLHFR